jgi:hypothetical protein
MAVQRGMAGSVGSLPGTTGANDRSLNDKNGSVLSSKALNRRQQRERRGNSESSVASCSVGAHVALDVFTSYFNQFAPTDLLSQSPGAGRGNVEYNKYVAVRSLFEEVALAMRQFLVS